MTNVKSSAYILIQESKFLVYNHKSVDISQLYWNRNIAISIYIILSIHVHLDEHNYLEILMVKGKTKGVGPSEFIGFWKLCLMKQKKLENAFTSLDFRKKSLIIKSLIFLFTFVTSITLVLSIQKVYSIEITLAWNMPAIEKLAGFRTFCREEGQDYNYNNPAWEGNVSTCTISNLKDGTLYYFVVRAYSTIEEESDNSNEIGFVSLMEDNNKNANIYNKLNGKWESIYILFGKLCVKDALFDKIELFFSLKNRNDFLKLYWHLK